MKSRVVRWMMLLALLLPAVGLAQEADKANQNHAKRERELAKTKERQAREDEKALEELKKRHYKNQTKDTRKRMRKTAKRSTNHNNNRGKFSFKRLFKGRR